MRQSGSKQCPSCGHNLPGRGERFCPACGKSLPQLRKKTSTSPPPSKKRWKADPLEGMRLDNKYRLIRKIGEGGMAKIYKAEHLFLGEIRAIKMVKRPDHRRETQYGRFLREARLARKISDLTPHIIRIDDFGYDQKQGVYYYSMEILEGKNLRELLREAPYYLSPKQVVHIALQICEAMDIAHQEKMVHRDLKPDNIFLINKDGDPLFVKILDFGLAKSLLPGEPNFTEVGKVVGTPEYMSPEQCRGPTPEERTKSISHVDGRSDVYSIGIVLYQCLVGRAPFVLEGEPTPQNFLKLMNRQISENPKPLLEVRKDIPPLLASTIERSIKKNPKRRFASMAEFRQAFLRVFPEMDKKAKASGGSSQMLRLGEVLSGSKAPRKKRAYPFKLQLDPELEF